MAGDDRWRNAPDRFRERGQGHGDMRDRDRGYGRESEERDDDMIARRGFGNERSGFPRGDDDQGGFGRGSRDDRHQEYGRPGGPRDQGGFGRGSREEMGERLGGGDRSGDEGRFSRGRGDERNTFGGNDYSGGFYGADQNHGDNQGRRDYGQERGFWDRASDEVSSWFGDDDARRRRERDERQGSDPGAQGHRGRGPKGYTRSDERIQEDVCERLSHDSYVDASEIEVSVSSREVTLSGTVDSREAKRRAEDIAEHVSGVAHVQNNLRVQQGSGSVGPIGAAASTTTGMSMETGLPTGMASGHAERSLQSSTGVSGTGSPATGSQTGPQGTGLGGVEVGPQGGAGRRKGGTT